MSRGVAGAKSEKSGARAVSPRVSARVRGSVPFAVNGFGRIGRLVVRAHLGEPRAGLRLAVINGTAPAETLAHLLRYDSTHGRFEGEVRARKASLELNGESVPLLCERDSARLDWKRAGASLVLECSGTTKSREAALRHLEAGAERLLVSAPCAFADREVVFGLNHKDLRARDRIVSAASCTTNCLAPLAFILHQAFGIERAFALTAHAFTSDQRLLDGTHSDLRRARAATASVVPAATGAAAALVRVMPELKGRIECAALRVPVPNVSRLELTCQIKRATDVGEVNRILQRAARAVRWRGVLDTHTEPLVSADLNGNPHSAVVDCTATRVVGGKLIHIAAWYDNEWGFACRMLDIAQALGKIQTKAGGKASSKAGGKAAARA